MKSMKEKIHRQPMYWTYEFYVNLNSSANNKIRRMVGLEVFRATSFFAKIDDSIVTKLVAGLVAQQDRASDF